MLRSIFKLATWMLFIISLPTVEASSRWLSLGSSHACSMTNDNTVQCWGSNLQGQLGNGSTGASISFATEIVNTSINVGMLANGASHSCVLSADGSIGCWGSNSHGELGRGGPLGALLNSALLDNVKGFEVGAGIYQATQIASGSSHTCALLINGKVRCWGRGNNGQLGNDGFLNNTESVEVFDIVGTDASTTAIQVAAGNEHTCALMKDRLVKCWGRNNVGQLGIGNANSPLATPQMVAGLNNVKAISTGPGARHTCALTTANEIWCWGNNNNGQIGMDPNDPNWNSIIYSPVKVIDSDAAEVVVAGSHSCARYITTNLVACWGNNQKGQLGDSSLQNKLVPSLALNVPPVRYLAAGGDPGNNGFTCARRLDNDKTICWGSNTSGQLGAGTISATSDPPLGIKEVEKRVVLTVSPGQGKIAAGDGHTCSMVTVNAVGTGLFCWGQNSLGQLGPAGGAGGSNPILIPGTFTTVSAGESHNCAYNNNNSLVCWGKNDKGQLGTSINFGNIKGLALGSSHSCVIDSNAKLLSCWGGNDYGQLGPNGVAGGTSSLTDVSAASLVATGSNHTCAAGTYQGQTGLYCWGLNDSAQLGTLINSTTNNPNPVPNQIANFANTTALAAGSGMTCAVGSYNNSPSGLYCWGANYDGQLGRGTVGQFFSQPQKTQIDSATAITAGLRHACAIGTKMGTTGLYCWGQNTYGQLGPNGNGMTETGSPVHVPLPGTVVTVAAGSNHTCASNNQNQLYCWGRNDFGQLGPLTSLTQTSTPTLIASPELPNIMDLISSGWFEAAR